MSDELKPCPFCGSNKIEYINMDERTFKWYHCDSCRSDGPMDLGESGAKEMWNIRLTEDALKAKLDMAKEILRWMIDADETRGFIYQAWAMDGLHKLNE